MPESPFTQRCFSLKGVHPMLRPSRISCPCTPLSFLSSSWSFLPRTLAAVENLSATTFQENLHATHSDLFFYQRSSVTAPLFVSGRQSIEEVFSGSWVDGDAETEAQMGVSGFIEVGYISGVHGLKGELRVKPNTEFPELRFCTPGTRWLKACIFGKERISEMHLTGGRSHAGLKSWIISFKGIETVDQAKQIVGSTLLVKEEDRPELEEDAFYTHDLIGMRVILKETGMLVGKVVNVLNTGANDLLHVLRDSSYANKDPSVLFDSATSEMVPLNPFVWIPFVKVIVPEIDMEKREMFITPPKGLLELNLHTEMRSKKQRRQMEWKQRKKLQQQLTAVKKKLHEIGQSHVLHGLSIGEKPQKTILAKQIVDINLRLFQHAVQSIETPSGRFSLYDFVDDNSNLLLKNALRIPYSYLLDCAYSEKTDELHDEGLQLLKNSKVAIILVINNENSSRVVSKETLLSKLQQLLLDYQRVLKFGEKCFEIPLIIVTSKYLLASCEKLFSENDYFMFNPQKVLFIEETKLPIISNSAESNRILMKSSWEILQSPIGSGGTFDSLSSHKALDLLQRMGVEYVQLCSLSERCAFGSPFFFGLACSRRADLALKILDRNEEDDYDIIFSIGQLSKTFKHFETIPFQAVPEQHRHVEQIDGEWLELDPTMPNSYRLHCSIDSSLFNSCNMDKVFILHVSE
ncbi:hypothetical protein HPP92_023296 [Vanilla planifolia]|uniref:Uncharacterized protein n=1 Tax=Vanilla planifolia TaxID=51239 RepID=A0A835UCQ0_VANPL|nr:hypothetical protein HPP92_023296 [Vanilla planifolia]